MYYYKIATLNLESCFRLPSFENFACDCVRADVVLMSTDEQPIPGKDNMSGSVVHRRVPGGWFFHPPATDRVGLYTNSDYTYLRMLGAKDKEIKGMAEWYVRIALECWLARHGYVSIHSAAVEINSEAYAFTGPSGVGKSTRAAACIDGLNAELINGDRPLIDVKTKIMYGVPWDGKEQCFRNVHYPLKAICEVRRSNSAYIRNLSLVKRRKIMMQQCFIPMWDSETAALQIRNISLLAKNEEIIRIFSGPTTEDVRALYYALQNHQYLKEEPDMKAKSGFVLRNVVDEYILMPTDDNIGKFNGTVLLNEVSAFVWEKLQNPLSKEDLLTAILDEFEVDRATASADLNALLETLRGYGVIEDD